MDELHHNRLHLSLAELYRNEKGICALTNTLREKEQAAAAATSTLVDREQTVKSFKKQHGRFTREQQHIEKEIRCVSVYFCFKGFDKMRARLTLTGITSSHSVTQCPGAHSVPVPLPVHQS